MKHVFLLVFSIFGLLVPVRAQYRGGGGDGYSILQAKGFQHALPGIYAGGPDDGHASVTTPNQNTIPGIYAGGGNDGDPDDGYSFNQPRASQHVTPEIYAGGVNDGFSLFATAAQNGLPGVYAGGLNDGVAFALAPGMNTPPPIYLGGSNDGFDMAGGRVALNGLPPIYAGGGNDADPDDGYSFVVSLSQNLSTPPVVRNERTTALLQLSGEWFNDDAVLGWKTGVENDLGHFELERSVDAGRSFSSVIPITPNTDAGSQHDYRCTDVRAYNLPADFLLYRLKSVGKNGGFTYSAIVKLPKDKTAPVIVAYPNPTSGRFTLAMLNVKDVSGYGYVLSSTDGKVIKRGSIHDATTSFDLSGYASATYQLFLFKDGKPVQHFTILLTQ